MIEVSNKSYCADPLSDITGRWSGFQKEKLWDNCCRFFIGLVSSCSHINRIKVLTGTQEH